MTRFHTIVGKSRLAVHVASDRGHNGLVVHPPLAELRRLRLDELQSMHRDLHVAPVSESENRALWGDR